MTEIDLVREYVLSKIPSDHPYTEFYVGNLMGIESINDVTRIITFETKVGDIVEMSLDDMYNYIKIKRQSKIDKILN